MQRLIDSYKKVYENKKPHIIIFLISFLWMLFSMLFDIKFSDIGFHRQNPIDVLFNTIIFAYSIKFIHNVINHSENSGLPFFKEVSLKIYWELIKLEFVWGLYAILFVIIAFALAYSLKSPIMVIACVSIFLFIALFAYYIFIALADNLSTKGLFNPILIFKIIPKVIKPFFANFGMFLLASLILGFIYFISYVIIIFFGIDTIGYLGNGWSVIDCIIGSFIIYFIVVTWYLAFPYSLIESYLEKIKPIINFE